MELPLAKIFGGGDLLITDLVIPSMVGWEFALEFRETQRGRKLRVFYISGYPESTNPVLLKGGLANFMPDSFLRRVRGILGPGTDANWPRVNQNNDGVYSCHFLPSARSQTVPDA